MSIGAAGVSIGAWVTGEDDRDDRVLFRVEGSAMEPAFSSGDFIRFPVYDGGDIERWDVLLFRFHLDEDRDMMKRVVALPSETVEVRKDVGIFINGARLTDDSYALEPPPNYDYGPKTVPADHYFVLGDNRRNSFDSHAWAASCAPELACDFVPAEMIEGVLPADAMP